jgi:hypothetical protein
MLARRQGFLVMRLGYKTQLQRVCLHYLVLLYHAHAQSRLLLQGWVELGNICGCF